MTEAIDEHFRRAVGGWSAVREGGPPPADVPGDDLLELFDAQALSRHLDFAARALQARGEGFYTIGSSGHESNAAVAMALRPSDPALLHYRSGGFYCARAAQLPGSDAAADLVHSLTCSVDDPISGGRHKVFGRADLAVVPQTSTIASHLPRAVGLAFALDLRERLGVESEAPDDAVVVASLGDASVNHSTAVGALNTAAQLAHRGVGLPLLVVVEDNGMGISVRTPPGWTRRALESIPGLGYLSADGADPQECLAVARRAVDQVRRERTPVVLHLSTVRLMGHAGSDVELAYRTSREIEADYSDDPLLATARSLVQHALLTPAEVVARYEAVGDRVTGTVESLLPVRRLDSAEAVMAPLALLPELTTTVRPLAPGDEDARSAAFGGRLPEDAGPMTLAQSLNAALTDLMVARGETLVFGEDVAVKGGVYGVTRGLRRRFGGHRVFDTLLDEQTILGTALGAALAGFLPVPEIQYLAYLHNAEDQLRGEAATLAFFSQGRYRNGMVVRIGGLAYQKGFGGHFHNDNSLAVLRDIPGLVLAVPSSAAEAPRMLRTLAALARQEGRVCVLVEPIALYHTRDLVPGDGAWTGSYRAPAEWGDDLAPLDRGTSHGPDAPVLVVTFGNGVPMSLRAVRTARQRAAESGRPWTGASVYDLRWLAPLPVGDLLARAVRARKVLVVDETRRSGGVSEAVVTALVDGGYRGVVQRVASQDAIIPLGPAASRVLLSEDDIVEALLGGLT